jgi:hypothetical protein
LSSAMVLLPVRPVGAQRLPRGGHVERRVRASMLLTGAPLLIFVGRPCALGSGPLVGLPGPVTRARISVFAHVRERKSRRWLSSTTAQNGGNDGRGCAVGGRARALGLPTSSTLPNPGTSGLRDTGGRPPIEGGLPASGCRLPPRRPTAGDNWLGHECPQDSEPPSRTPATTG